MAKQFSFNHSTASCHFKGVGVYTQICSCFSVTKSRPTLCDPMDCSTSAFSVQHYSWEFPQIYVHWVGDAIQPSYPLSSSISQSLLKLLSIESMMPSNYLILCCPLLLLPSIFPSIRVFCNESALHIRWPKYWSFSVSISPSSEHSGLLIYMLTLFLGLVFLSLPFFIQEAYLFFKSLLRFPVFWEARNVF